jgi:3-dehydroquinate synthase
MPPPILIPVKVNGHEYPVIVGQINDAKTGLGPAMRTVLNLSVDSKPLAVIITNTTLVDLLVPRVKLSLEEANFRVVIATFEPGESHKNLATIQSLFDQIMPHKPERSTPVIALGGGIVTDVAGFVSATLLRGTPLVSVPTTLLAMVDSSVGGKTGVNHAAGKNLIGSFHQPSLVFIDPTTLDSLPSRELSAGLAECIKHDLIRDGGHFAKLPQLVHDVLWLNREVVSPFIAHNVRIKAGVVEQDPFERTVRAHLNLGHTFGHAFETVLDYQLLHGECVALGIVCAAWVSKQLKLISDDELSRIISTLTLAGLPTRGVKTKAAHLNVDQIVAVMHSDKKVRDGKIRLVLLDGIGRAIVRNDVEESLMREAIEKVM